MSRHEICKTEDLPAGNSMIVTLERKSIGVFNVNGNYCAIRNRCPHQGAPLCMGSVKGTNLPSAPGEYVYSREGEILRCPWHGWEFDITTGKSIFDPVKCLVKSYDVAVEAAFETSPEVETYPVEVEANKIVVYV